MKQDDNDRKRGHQHDHDRDPIAESLDRAASGLTLRPGSYVRVVRKANRRQHRRHRVVAASAVVAVGGGAALTIQQLTQSDGGTLRSPVDDGEGSVVDDVPDTIAPPDATSPPNDPNAAGAAVRVESDLVWNVVTPDTASAVGFTYGPVELPGMVVSTAPGRDTTGGQPVVWRSDDGITWEPLDVELPVGSLFSGNVAFDGDRIYAVGTSPGIAATEPNPLLLASSSDAGATWNTITLPIDSNSGADLPFVRISHATGSAMPIESGVLVVVNTIVELDYERLGLTNYYGSTADGVMEQADPDCIQRDSALRVASTIPIANPATAGDLGGCEMVTRPWSEYGVPPETVAAMFDQPSRFFIIADDGSTTEIDGPGTTGRLAPVGMSQGPNPIFFASDPFSYRIGSYRYLDDGSWQELDVPAGVSDIRPAGDAIVATMSDGYSTEVAMSRDGTNWTRTDISALYDEPSLLSTWPLSTSATGAMTMAVSSTPDPIAAKGGAEITIGGVTARVDRAGGHVMIIDYATGEPIDAALITDTNVGVSVADDDGGVRALFPMEALFENLMTTPGNQLPHWDVVRTLDGVSFSRESIAELLGLTDADISSVAHISPSGAKVVVAVTLTERDDTDMRKQLILVGTPRG